jgi:hypothetical protein
MLLEMLLEVEPRVTICFTICLFISPDLDGNRGTSTKKCAPRDPQRHKESMWQIEND